MGMATDIDADVLANNRYYTNRLLGSAHTIGNKPNDRPCIRLLQVKPGLYGDLIQCELKTFSLDTAPTFNALSYSWGHTTSSTVISLDDGFLFRVRQNLEAALQRIRDPAEIICIWIDAICINQADLRERSDQIRLMGEIYSRATRVLVWLGEARAPPDKARAMHTSVVSLAQQREHIWWRRIWVVQETICAKQRPMIMFGPFVLEWEDFMFQWHELYQKSCASVGRENDNLALQETEFLRCGLEALKMLEKLWSTTVEERQLYQILTDTREYLCVDEHDRIYALIHLLPIFEKAIFSLDYNIPTAELFAIATQHCIRTSPSGFDILFRAWERGTDGDLSTWWLDISKPLRSSDVPFFCGNHRIDKFRSPDVEMAMSGKTPILYATGLSLEEVALVRPFRTLFESNTSKFSIQKWLALLQDIMFRETQDQMLYFASKPKMTMRYRKPSKISTLGRDIIGLRLGMIKSLIWIYRTYATSLSDRMTKALKALDSISDDVFKLEDDEWNDDVVKIAGRQDPQLLELLKLLMDGLYPLLASHVIFITTHGFVGFCRYRKVRNDDGAKPSYESVNLGDRVIMLRGGSCPFVVRPVVSKNTMTMTPTPADRLDQTSAQSRLCADDKDSLRTSSSNGTESSSKTSSSLALVLKRTTSRSTVAIDHLEERFNILDCCCVPAIMTGQLQQFADGEHQALRSFAFV